jgi:uncharacterized membrane protein
VFLLYYEKFLEFLEFVRDSKKKHVFTNMEKNLYNALKDPATLTELAVLALYAQAISSIYAPNTWQEYKHVGSRPIAFRG